MSFFSDAVAARLAGRTVQAAQLLYLGFVGAPLRCWLGAATLVTTDGNSWLGLDNIGAIEGLQYMTGTAASQVTFTLSALDPTILTLAQQQASLVKNQPAAVYIQFFDANWQCLDAPYAIWSGLMDVMNYTMSNGEARTYRVSVTAETPWSNRNRAPNGYYDPQDQAARGYPADTGLNQVPVLQGVTIRWKTK